MEALLAQCLVAAETVLPGVPATPTRGARATLVDAPPPGLGEYTCVMNGRSQGVSGSDSESDNENDKKPKAKKEKTEDKAAKAEDEGAKKKDKKKGKEEKEGKGKGKGKD